MMGLEKSLEALRLKERELRLEVGDEEVSGAGSS